jgi:hypothetical protein
MKHILCLTVLLASAASFTPAMAAGITGIVMGSWHDYNPNRLCVVDLLPGVNGAYGFDRIDWGTPVPGSFQGRLEFWCYADRAINVGEQTVLGYLWYVNRAVSLLDDMEYVTLRLTLTASDPSLDDTKDLAIRVV